jgi:hypothetical protein
MRSSLISRPFSLLLDELDISVIMIVDEENERERKKNHSYMYFGDDQAMDCV